MSKKANLPSSWDKQKKIEWYQDKITEIKVKLAVAQPAKDIAVKRVDHLLNKLRNANAAIYDLRHTETSDNVPSITDHAVVRYMQRRMGIDINEIKLQIAQDRNVAKDGNVIVTVLE